MSRSHSTKFAKAKASHYRKRRHTRRQAKILVAESTQQPGTDSDSTDPAAPSSVVAVRDAKNSDAAPDAGPNLVSHFKKILAIRLGQGRRIKVSSRNSVSSRPTKRASKNWRQIPFLLLSPSQAADWRAQLRHGISAQSAAAQWKVCEFDESARSLSSERNLLLFIQQGGIPVMLRWPRAEWEFPLQCYEAAD